MAIEKFRKLAPIDDSTDLLWLLYLSEEGKDRERTSEMLDIILHQKAGLDYREKILLDPGNDCDGEYRLGKVIYPGSVFSDFGLCENEWVKHLLITGMTGTGKTNLCFHILRQLRKRKKPFLVFDWKKNYRDLTQLSDLKATKTFTIGSVISPFYFNPLIPPDRTDPGHWLVRLVDIIKHAYFLGDGVEYLLRESINGIYEENGVYNGPGACPTFSDVKEVIEGQNLKGRMSLWKASAVRALASMTFEKSLGRTLECREKADITNLLQANVVMELDALSNNDKVFFTEALILWIYEHRKNDAEREKFKHAIVIEEGHHILSKSHGGDGEETIIETSLRQIREFGESVIVLDQEPSKLSNSIKANTYTKITFNLGNGIDIKDISTCMTLDHEETGYIDLLTVGKAIIKLKGRVHKPMLVSFPLVPIKKGKVTDELLNRKSESIQGTPQGCEPWS